MENILRLILGDQLNSKHSWFAEKRDDVLYLMMEIKPEAIYVTHHIQKLIGFFAAMRAFAEALRSEGHRIIYLKLDDPDNLQSFEKNTDRVIDHEKISKLEYLEPDEYRLDRQFKKYCASCSIPAEMFSTEHFLTTPADFKKIFENKKTYLMERFYREIRRRYDILMDGDQPLGGHWNYDQENRKKLPADHILSEIPGFDHDVTALYKMIEKADIPFMGTVEPQHFRWPLNRGQALSQLDYFLDNNLEFFGAYQDAMDDRYPFMHHSCMSFALNTKILHPLEVVNKAIEHWQNNQDTIDIAQVEGFVRQIIGWREFMRGVYRTEMPEYAGLNFFGHRRPLPEFYWTAETKMYCLKQAIGQSLIQAYAHHIQRLMITGNFALLAGVDPDAVDAWYLGIYIDAIQWVEITNTRGMSQYADGGLVATKPYISSANYINKMSNYCRQCPYDRKKRHGQNACPFNSLYWYFFIRHRSLLENNPRVAMPYRLLSKMDKSETAAIKKQAEKYQENIDEL